MVPLRITFKVSSEVSSPQHPMHLDSLLAFALTRFHLDPDDPQAPRDVSALRAIADALPLERFERDGAFVWKASAIQPVGPVHHSSRFYTQRMDKMALAIAAGSGRVQWGRYQPDPRVPAGADMAPHQGKIDTLRGPFRNLCDYYPTLLADEWVAWCIGDEHAIRELLIERGYVTHLGARGSKGHGQIREIAIARDETALELWKRRVRPWRMVDDDVDVQWAWKLPYWEKAHKGPAYCPASLF